MTSPEVRLINHGLQFAPLRLKYGEANVLESMYWSQWFHDSGEGRK